MNTPDDDAEDLLFAAEQAMGRLWNIVQGHATKDEYDMESIGDLIDRLGRRRVRGIRVDRHPVDDLPSSERS